MFQDLFDFEKWAPRSSQAWRFGQDPSSNRSSSNSTSTSSSTPSSPQIPTPSMSQEDVEVLNQRLAEIRSVDDDALLGLTDETYFTDSTDSELADALEAQIARLASPSTSASTSSSSTGKELIELIYSKYGKQHDVSFVRRDIPGKTLVSLNLYHAHIGQRSFPMTKEDYEEKMDGVAMTLNAWGQWHTVETFLKEPIAPRRGLPSRPIVGNAVSIKLELTKEQIQEWFGR